MKVLSPTEFQQCLNSDPDALLLDVRTSEEYEASHLNGAMLLNWLDTDKFKSEAKNIGKNKHIYIYCRSGRRSNEAAQYLSTEGYNVTDLDGGIMAWENANLPVTK